jgi:hypothetical protein
LDCNYGLFDLDAGWVLSQVAVCKRHQFHTCACANYTLDFLFFKQVCLFGSYVYYAEYVIQAALHANHVLLDLTLALEVLIFVFKFCCLGIKKPRSSDLHVQTVVCFLFPALENFKHQQLVAYTGTLISDHVS